MMKEKLYTTNFISARSLDLESKYSMDIRYSEKVMSGLSIENTTHLGLKDKIPLDIIYKEEEIFSTYYVANMMYKYAGRLVRINEFEENNSTIFILPCLGLPKHTVKLHSNFVNAYVSHYNYADKVGDTLFLVYRYMPFDFYSNVLMKGLEKSPLFLTCERDEDERFDIVRMTIPTTFKDDIDKVLEGRYSHTSESFKYHILLFDNRKKDDIIRQVLYNSAELRYKLSEQFGTSIPENIDLRTKPIFNEERWSKSKFVNLTKQVQK